MQGRLDLAQELRVSIDQSRNEPLICSVRGKVGVVRSAARAVDQRLPAHRQPLPDRIALCEKPVLQSTELLL